MVAGTRASPSNCASRRAARMLSAISKTLFRPSSMKSGIWKFAGQPKSITFAFYSLIENRATDQRAQRCSGGS